MTVGSLPACPPPHPVRKGTIVRRTPATMAVRRSGMQGVSVIPIGGMLSCISSTLRITVQLQSR